MTFLDGFKGYFHFESNAKFTFGSFNTHKSKIKKIIQLNLWSKFWGVLHLDLVFPQKKEYSYSINNFGIDDELNNRGFLLKSFGLQADYSYLLFKKLSLGAVGGFQMQSSPDLSMLKLGGVLRYYFVDRNNIYLYLQLLNNFTLDTDRFKNGSNFRFGLGFPVWRKDKFNLNVNVFFEQNDFILDGAKPLLGTPGEIPRGLNVKSLGISLGIRFKK